MKPRVLGLLFLCALTLIAHPAPAQDDLQYQRRGNRNEGLKPRPVSGYDVELLSARVDHPEDMSRLGATLAFRFFLKERTEVYPLVRELEYKYDYVLDKVQPGKAWQVGFGNVFEWPTAVVLGRIGELKPSDLGIVVRLGRPTPSVDEQVAPIVFYQSVLQPKVNGYLFTFSLRDDGAVTAKIFREGDDKDVFTQRFSRVSGGRPFTVKWNLVSAAVPEGRYRLVLMGYFLDSNRPIQQTVRFYHQPNVRLK
jgi:hypothetical protein